MQLYALIPAAGHSRRMGRPKLSLPLGGRSVLECAASALRQAGVADVLVVVGPHVAELADLAERAGASVCRLPEPTPDMRTTIEHGLDWLRTHRQPSEDDTWLLVPADHPTLSPDVVGRLARALAGHPERSIAVPVFEGKRGHPTLLRWRHAAGLRAHPAGLGVNTYVRQNPDAVLEVVVEDAEILRDLDTPDDYRRLQEDHKELLG